MSGAEDCPITLWDSDDDTGDVITDSITITRRANLPLSAKPVSHIAAILAAPALSTPNGTSDPVLNRSKSSFIQQAPINGSVSQVNYPQRYTVLHRPQDVTQTQQYPSYGLSPWSHNPPSSTQTGLPVDHVERFYKTQIPPSDQGIQMRNKYASSCPTKPCSQMMRQTTIAPEDAAGVTRSGTSAASVGHQKQLHMPHVVGQISQVVDYIVEQSYKMPGSEDKSAEEKDRVRVLHSASRASTPDSVIIESVEGPCVDSSKIPVTAIQASEKLQAQIKSTQAPLTPSIKILDSFSLRDCLKNSRSDVEIISQETVAPVETNKIETSPKTQPVKADISPSVKTYQDVKPSHPVLLSDLCLKAFYQCCVGECVHSSVCPSEFQDHLLSKHLNAEEFLCVHCGDVAPSVPLFMQHLHHHANNNSILRCNYPDCHFNTSFADSFTRHFYHCHDKAEHHMCLLCGQLFNSALEMLIHMKTNFLNIVQCPHCSAKDVTKGNIIRHMAKSHPDKGKLVTVSRQIVCRERLRNCWPMLRKSGSAQNTNGSVALSVTQDVSQVATSDRVKLTQTVELTDRTSEDVSVIESRSVGKDNFVPIMSVKESAESISVKRVRCKDDFQENDQHCHEMPLLDQMKCDRNVCKDNYVPIMSVQESDNTISVERVKCEDDLEENVQHCHEMPVLDLMKCDRNVCKDNYVPIMSVQESDIAISVERVRCEHDLAENDQHSREMPVLDQVKCATDLSDFAKTETEGIDCTVKQKDWKKDDIDSDRPITRRNSQLMKDSTISESSTERESGKRETVKSEIFVSPSLSAKKRKSFQKVHVCSKCDFYTTSSGLIYKHVREVHKMDDMFQCSECHGYVCQDDVIPHHVKHHPDGDEDYIPSALSHAFNVRYMKKSAYRQSSARLEIGKDTSTSIDPVEDVTSSLMARLSEANEGDKLKLTSYEASILNKIINERQNTPSIVSGHRKPNDSGVHIVKETTIPMVKPNQSSKKRHASKHNSGPRKRQRLEIQEISQEGTEDDRCQEELDTFTGEVDSLREISEDGNNSDDDTSYDDPSISTASVKSELISPNRCSSAGHVISPKISKSHVLTPLMKTESSQEPSPKRNQSPLRGPSLKYRSPVKGPSPIKNKSPLKGRSPNNCLSPVKNPSEAFSKESNNLTPKKEKSPVDETSIVRSPLPMKHWSPIKVLHDGTGPNLTFSQVDFDDPSYEFRCKYCTYRKGSLDKFLHHTYYHFHYRPYTCGFCDFKAFSHNRVLTHIKGEHPMKATEPVVKRVEIDKLEARCQKTAMICFIPKHVEDLSLKRRVMMKKERQLQKKMSIKKEVKVNISNSVQRKKQSNNLANTSKTKLKMTKTSSVKFTNKPEKEGSYLCPYCRTKRPLMTWTKVMIEICYHIHYKPLKCNYCDELQSASMYCVQKHTEKVHPGKEVIAREDRDPHKEIRLKQLLQRSMELSQKYRQELKRQELSVRSKKGKKKRPGVARHPTAACGGEAVSGSDVTVRNTSCTKQTSLNSASAVTSTSKTDSPRLLKHGEKCVNSKETSAEKGHCSEDIADKKSDSHNTLSASPEDMTVKKSHELFKETCDDYGGTLYECLKCEYTIRNLKSMYTHSYKHQPKIFKCHYCDFGGYPRSTTVWHQKQQHFRLKPKVINLALQQMYRDEDN